MKAQLILGCEGHTQNNICFCKGVENVILDLETIQNSEHYFDTIVYLDNVTKVFERVCNKPHVISNAIYKLYEWEYFDDEFNNRIKYFYEMHRRCGLVLFAKPKIGDQYG